MVFQRGLRTFDGRSRFGFRIAIPSGEFKQSRGIFEVFGGVKPATRLISRNFAVFPSARALKSLGLACRVRLH